MIKYLRTSAVLICIIAAEVSQGQDTATTWLDGFSEETTEAGALYYRETWRENDLWMVRDYHKNGNLHMTGSFSSLDPKVKDGDFVYFNEDNVKTSEGRYTENQKTGFWTYRYKDGSIRERGNHADPGNLPLGRFKAPNTDMPITYSDTSKIRNGEWEYYHENGQMSARAVFENNVLTAVEYWNEDGTEAGKEFKEERLPEFPGGEAALMRYLGNNIQYPRKDKRKGIQGTVYVRFVVDRYGKLNNPRVVKSVSSGLDAECMRVVSRMPQWTPGVQFNRKVSVEYNLPIKFTLK